MIELSLIVASLFTFYLVFVVPVFGYWSYRWFLKNVALDPVWRMQYYLLMMVLQCLRLVVVGGIALLGVVQLSMFGLCAPNYVWLQSVGVPIPSPQMFTLFLLLGLVFLTLLGAIVTRRRLEKPGQLDRYRALLSVKELLPHTDQERRLWLLVSISVGICEEIVYRGFLTWYCLQIGNMLGLQISFLLALTLSTVIFALGHSYQGRSGILGATLLGVTFAYFYGITGSLLIPIVLHVLTGARIVYFSSTVVRLTSQNE